MIRCDSYFDAFQLDLLPGPKVEQVACEGGVIMSSHITHGMTKAILITHIHSNILVENFQISSLDQTPMI